MGDSDKVSQSLEGLRHCDGFIKKNLKERFRLKAMPQLKFILDKSIDHGIKVSELLENLRKKEE